MAADSRPYNGWTIRELCYTRANRTKPSTACTLGKLHHHGHFLLLRYEDEYKSARELVHLLLEIVAKGGNLALNVGPQPDGRLPVGAIKSMKDLGAWMKVNGEGIYGTRVCAPYVKDSCAFTRKGDTVYAFRMYKSAQDKVEETIHIPYTEAVNRIDLVGGPEGLAFTKTEQGIEVELPITLVAEEAPIAHVFRIS